MGARGGFAGWESSPNGAAWPEEETSSESRQETGSSRENAVEERRNSGLTASTRQPSHLLENFKLLGAGGIAGAFSKSCTAPLARLTILYQVINSLVLGLVLHVSWPRTVYLRYDLLYYNKVWRSLVHQ